MTWFEKPYEIIRHEAVNSEVSIEDYVKQDTPRSCGVAVLLMARNLLTGRTFPNTVNETLKIMQKRGYPPKSSGRTSSVTRSILVEQLNEYQETRLVHKVLGMPENKGDYSHKLLSLLQNGAVVMVGFKEPYFDLPEGLVDVTEFDVSHGVLVHGFKQDGQNLTFIITDPDKEVVSRFGMNISVSMDKFYECLSKYSRDHVEVVFTALQ